MTRGGWSKKKEEGSQVHVAACEDSGEVWNIREGEQWNEGLGLLKKL